MKDKRKNKHMRWLLTGIILVLGLMFLPENQSEVNAATRINYTSIKLGQGKSKQLKLKGTSAKAKWTSSNTKIVTVNKKTGMITAVKGGKATITAKVGKRKYYCRVTVVGISATKLTMTKGRTYTFKIKNGKNTKWKTSNAAVVSVSSKGKIKAKGAGGAVITCKTNGRTLKCKVYVPMINNTALRMPVNTQQQLTVSGKGDYIPAWSSSNQAVATVDNNGMVTATATMGQSVISCKVGTVTLQCKVTVVSPGNIVTPMSDLSLNTKTAQYTVSVEGYPNQRTYTIFGQGYKQNKSSVYPNYIGGHGCAACAVTTVLTGYKGEGYTPALMIEVIEKNLFGSAYTTNYSKSDSEKMPLSLYGISQVLSSQGINNQYVRSFDDVQALNEITQHLKTGNPVVIIVKDKNRSTGKKDTTWASSGSKHTMVILGLTDTGMAIVADSANRASTFGTCGRLKYTSLVSLIPYMFSSSNVTSTAAYYTKESACGGYILVNPE